VVQIKSGKRENGKSFWDNLYRKRSARTHFAFLPSSCSSIENIPPTRYRATSEKFKGFQDFYMKEGSSQGRNLALTGPAGPEAHTESGLCVSE